MGRFCGVCGSEMKGRRELRIWSEGRSVPVCVSCFEYFRRFEEIREAVEGGVREELAGLLVGLFRRVMGLDLEVDWRKVEGVRVPRRRLQGDLQHFTMKIPRVMHDVIWRKAEELGTSKRVLMRVYMYEGMRVSGHFGSDELRAVGESLGIVVD